MINATTILMNCIKRFAKVRLGIEIEALRAFLGISLSLSKGVGLHADRCIHGHLCTNEAVKDDRELVYRIIQLMIYTTF